MGTESPDMLSDNEYQRMVINRSTEFKQNYRTTDPDSSVLAGTETTKSGRRADHMMRVINMVKQFPGHTAAELASIADYPDMDRYEFSRRLSDARNLELINDCGKTNKRECKTTHNPSLVWYPVG